MTAKFQSHLAAQTLSDGHIVTYQSLSREKKVSFTEAKEVLYDFHRVQNSKKAGAVHATYLVSGMRLPPTPQSSAMELEQDSVPMSSPFPASSQVETPVDLTPKPFRSIKLVREEDLENEIAQFAKLLSVHVYSLEQSSLKVIGDTAQKQLFEQATDDDLRIYGTIMNPNVQRRTGKKPSVQTLPSVINKAPAEKPKEAPKPVSQSKPAPAAAKARSNAPGNFFKPVSRSNSTLSKADTPREPKDEPMKEDSDDGGEEDLLVPTKQKETAAAAKLSAAERDEELRRMMDEDMDELMEDAPVSAQEVKAEQEPEPEPEAPAEKDAEVKTEAPAPGGRRRGKRKVMKKITEEDAEGYIVTREEAVWESYSEDEAPPPKKKAATISSGSQKSKPAGGKANIMSFFSKK